jgi:hypothetical protein
MGGAQGNTTGTPLQTATNTSITNSLNNPLGGYGLDQVAQIRAANDADTNAQFAAEQKQLDEGLAARGLGASSIGQGYYGDLAGQQARAIASANAGLTANAAQLGQAGTIAAQNAGTNASATQNNSQLNWLNSLMGYGQQGFNNDLATNAANQTAQNNYQNYILQLLGLGYSPTG